MLNNSGLNTSYIKNNKIYYCQIHYAYQFRFPNHRVPDIKVFQQVLKVQGELQTFIKLHNHMLEEIFILTEHPFNMQRVPDLQDGDFCVKDIILELNKWKSKTV